MLPLVYRKKCGRSESVALEERKIAAFAKPVSSLPDQPSQAGYTAAELKAAFDSNAEELRQAMNGLIDDIVEIVIGKLHEHGNKEVLDSIAGVSQKLGSAADKVPSEAAVSEAMVKAGAGDMLSSVYDPQGHKEDIFEYTNKAAETAKNEAEKGKQLQYREVSVVLDAGLWNEGEPNNYPADASEETWTAADAFIVTPAPESMAAYSAAGVRMISVNDVEGSMMFVAEEVPEDNLVVNVLILPAEVTA